MDDKEYDALACSSISWICSTCGKPNFSFTDSFFESESFLSFDQNRFSPLNQTDCHSDPTLDTPLTSPFKPQRASTPPKNKVVKNKKNVKSTTDGICTDTKPLTKNSFTTLNINFCSYFSKRDTFLNLIASLSQSPDVIFGTETWLTSDFLTSELNLIDYDIYRRDREEKGGGGIFIGVKKKFKSVLISKGKFSESVFVKIPVFKKPPVIVSCIYRAPDLSLDQCQNLCEDIREVKAKFKRSVFWLAGDFNLPDIDWNYFSTTGHNYSRSINQIFLDLICELGLSQTVDRPTRGKNILDLVFTSNLDLHQKSQVIPGVSDHDAVLTESKLFFKIKKPNRREIKLWNKADMTKLRTDTKNFATLFKVHHGKHLNDINSMWSCIKANLQLIINDNVPCKMTSSGSTLPWITAQTKRLIRNRNKWYKRAKKRDDPKSWRKYREVKQLTQKLCRKSHDSYVRDLISDDKSNKKFWAYIKSQRTENTGISDLISGNRTFFRAKDKADLFNETYSKAFSEPCDTPYPPPTFSDTSNFLDKITVSKKGVLTLLQNIKENKATGPDEIPGKFLKICAFELHEIFTILFQTSLNLGIVPDEWKVAHIFPLFKKGDKTKAENYRPISLTSISCKLLEHIVHSTVMGFLDSNKILSPFQHGFRQKRSCESQLLTTLRDFSDSLNSSGQTDAILLDFSKAFDKVDHRLLLSKMNNLGICGPLLKWATSFLSNRLQHVVVDGCISGANKVLSGVPQGTVLGPLFFLIYINDIADNLSPGTSIRLFADDSLLYRIIKSEQDVAILQKDLDTLQRWETKNKMEFHPGKCQVIRVTNKVGPILGSYNIHGVTLQFFNAVKYLGVTIDAKLSWKEQCDNVCRKAHFMLSFLERNFFRCPPKVKEQCYFALVRPLLEYGCTAWDPYRLGQIEQLEKVNKRAARFVTGNSLREHGNTQKNMETLGWPPLYIRRSHNKLSMFYKIRNELICIPSEDLKPNIRKPDSFVIPSSSIDAHKHSFFPSTIRLWNSLPPKTKSSPSLTSFKVSLEKITPPSLISK